jgi:hypothetical protein
MHAERQSQSDAPRLPKIQSNMSAWCSDFRPNDTQHNGNRPNVTDHPALTIMKLSITTFSKKDTQNNGTQHNDSITAFSIAQLSIKTLRTKTLTITTLIMKTHNNDDMMTR